MIIIGYQGIGKSTLSSQSKQYIDLESSCFWVNEKRDSNWAIPYTNIANDLSNQGYDVFVSSHDVVRKALKHSNENVVCCVPDISLKDKWIEKLKKRYDKSKLDKDRKAYLNAANCYEENINEIMNSGFNNIVIQNMNYTLTDLIDSHIQHMKIHNSPLKVFISQPIHGISDEKIAETRERAIINIKNILGENIEIIQSEYKDVEQGTLPLQYVALSIYYLAGADVVYFTKGYEEYRGCVLEHKAAISYNIRTITE